MGIWDLKQLYRDYKDSPSYGTINSFYSSIGGIILSTILFILYLLEYITIEDILMNW